MTNMVDVRDFIATLHVIAAGDAPEDRLRPAVREAFARFVKEARSPLGNQTAVRVCVVNLQDELMAMVAPPQSERFKIVRDCALVAAIKWLRDN
jgi:hypothetical protein